LNLVERIMSQRLDRGKPLWEVWMVSGLVDGLWAVISKAHHAMVDGVSGTDPLTLIVDTFRRSRGPERKPWDPAPIPSALEMAAGSVASLAFNPVEQYRLARSVARPIRSLVNRAAIARSPNRSLVGAVGPHRRWRSADLELGLIREIRTAHDATTNDVVLALICRGFQTMFVDSGQTVPTRIRTVVPFAVGQSGVFTNQIASQTVDLPTNADSFAKMVHRIAAQTTGPHNATAIGGTALQGLDGLAAPTLAALGLRQATRTGLRAGNVDTAIINAPGPSKPVTLLGSTMNWIVPAIPLVAKVRIGVGVMSYRDKIVVGVTGDRDAELEIEAIALSIDGAERSLADLTSTG
jgi:WS/DGAT/MGAT family acyltransferase